MSEVISKSVESILALLKPLLSGIDPPPGLTKCSTWFQLNEKCGQHKKRYYDRNNWLCRSSTSTSIIDTLTTITDTNTANREFINNQYRTCSVNCCGDFEDILESVDSQS
eukprot:Pgem_evm1s9262